MLTVTILTNVARTTFRKKNAYLLLFYDFVAIAISILIEKNSSQTVLILSGFCYKKGNQKVQEEPQAEAEPASDTMRKRKYDTD